MLQGAVTHLNCHLHHAHNAVECKTSENMAQHTVPLPHIVHTCTKCAYESADHLVCKHHKPYILFLDFPVLQMVVSVLGNGAQLAY